MFNILILFRIHIPHLPPRRQVTRHVRKLALEMIRNLLSRRNPRFITRFLLDIQHEGPQILRSTRLPQDTRVHGDIHEFRRSSLSFAVEHVEGGLEVPEIGDAGEAG